MSPDRNPERRFSSSRAVDVGGPPTREQVNAARTEDEPVMIGPRTTAHRIYSQEVCCLVQYYAAPTSRLLHKTNASALCMQTRFLDSVAQARFAGCLRVVDRGFERIRPSTTQQGLQPYFGPQKHLGGRFGTVASRR